jgi:pimeloyl-ACP methyl ester carboxylesterase
MSRRVAAATACVLGVVLLAACGDDSSGVIDEPQVGAPEATPVTLTTDDGIELGGLLFEPPQPAETAVVLAHMRGSSKEAWTDAAVALAKNRIAALMFDFRGYAGQEGVIDTALDVDVTAALTDVRARGAEHVFVVGASMGATAAIAAAAEHKIDGIVAVSPAEHFADLDALGLAADVEEPTLFIAARDDAEYADTAEQLAEITGGGVVMYDGAAHGTDLLDDHHDELIAAIIRFVKSPPPPAP